MEFLPVLERDSERDSEFDWLSVMLYGSNIGGQNVYTRTSDGKTIASNIGPSKRDTARLNAIYPAKAPRPNPCLLNQDCSPAKALFYKTLKACTPGKSS